MYYNKEDIKSIIESTSLPLHVLCMPDLPNFKELEELSVKRISMGDFLYDYLYKQLDKTMSKIISEGSFKTIF